MRLSTSDTFKIMKMLKINRMLWPDFRTEMLGKIWISFTFLILTPSLLYLLYRIVETLMTNI